MNKLAAKVSTLLIQAIVIVLLFFILIGTAKYLAANPAEREHLFTQVGNVVTKLTDALAGLISKILS